MPIGLGIGMGVAGIGGSILSSGAQKEAAANALAAQQQSIQALFSKLDAVGMPPDQSARVILQQYQQAGILTPALMQQVQAAQSQFANIKQNQQATQFQSQALQRMAQLGQAGLTPDEVAQNRALQLQAAQQGNAAQQSIIQNMAQRGMQGGGAELAARLGAAQSMANTSSTAADQVSSMAAQRALQAIAQGSGMAGQLEAQTFGEQAQQASAADQMNRFNIQNQMAINQQNIAAQNQAQAANLANKQQLENANVSGYNQESYNQLQRQRQNWLDKLQYAQSYGVPLQNYGNAGAQAAYAQGNAQSNMISGITGSVGSGLGAMGLMGAFGGGGSQGGMQAGSGSVGMNQGGAGYYMGNPYGQSGNQNWSNENMGQGPTMANAQGLPSQ